MSQVMPTYEVYLDTEGFPLDLTSPVRTTDVMYYDSGIWIGRDEDRIFVPYHQLEVIREVDEPERATGGETEATAKAETEAGVEAETDAGEEGETDAAKDGDGEPTDEPPTDPVE